MARRCVLLVAIAAAFSILVLCSARAYAQKETGEVIKLFNGKDLSGLYPFVRGGKPGEDPEGVFTVKDGMIYIKGRPAGYLMTEKEYENYRVVIEYKWVVDEKGRGGGNSGLLVHCQPPDKVWPKSLECQMMYKNEGDFWVIGGVTINVEGVEPQGRRYRRHASGTKPLGEWNRMEVTCWGDTVTVVVNGVEVNKATNCSVTRGKICVQSEGAPLVVRKWELYPLKAE